MRIVISGTVGVGKSTISNLLNEKLKNKTKNLKFIKEETVNSVYLDYYYKNPRDWAFIAQLDFLMDRFKEWLINEKRISALGSEKNLTIYDRHFLDDYVFAELHTIKDNISNLNSLTYQAVYKEIIEKMNEMHAKPDYFILLSAELPTILKRLNGRARNIELETDKRYWEELYFNYYQRSFFRGHFKKHTKNFVVLTTENKTPDQIVNEIIEIIGIT